MEFLILIVIIFVVFIITGWRSLKKRQVIIPEKIGSRSYIDEKTGTIFLRSWDYQTKGGEEWVVSKSSITVNRNDSTKSEIFPLAKIHTMEVHRKEPYSILSFEILDIRFYEASEGGGEHVVPVALAPIFFKNEDIRFAQTICNRVANAT